MKETPYVQILDRDEALVHVQQHLSPTVELLRDVTNYGTNLIPRCFVSSDRKLTEFVVVSVLLRQVVAMLDAIEVLISNGIVYPTHLNARALFEASLSIDWILQQDTENRARHYYVAKLRKDRLWAARTQAESPEGKHFDEEIFLPDRPALREAGRQQMAAIDKLLVLPTYASINAVFDQIRGKRKQEPNWYAPLGIKNLREMAEAVDRLKPYRVFYTIASEAVHGVNSHPHVSVGDGILTIEPLRSLAGIRPILQFALVSTFDTYRSVLRKYRSGEEAAFGRKYRENWRVAFLSIPEFQYKRVNVTRI